jgi:hypothetical protein
VSDNSDSNSRKVQSDSICKQPPPSKSSKVEQESRSIREFVNRQRMLKVIIFIVMLLDNKIHVIFN